MPSNSDLAVRRRNPNIVVDTPQTRQPARQAHGDQTRDAAIARVHLHLPADEAPELLKKRFQIVGYNPLSFGCYFNNNHLDQSMAPNLASCTRLSINALRLQKRQHEERSCPYHS